MQSALSPPESDRMILDLSDEDRASLRNALDAKSPEVVQARMANALLLLAEGLSIETSQAFSICPKRRLRTGPSSLPGAADARLPDIPIPHVADAGGTAAIAPTFSSPHVVVEQACPRGCGSVLRDLSGLASPFTARIPDAALPRRVS